MFIVQPHLTAATLILVNFTSTTTVYCIGLVEISETDISKLSALLDTTGGSRENIALSWIPQIYTGILKSSQVFTESFGSY